MADPEAGIGRALKSWGGGRQPSPDLTERILLRVQRRIRHRRAALGAATIMAVGAAVGVPLAIGAGADHGRNLRVVTASGPSAPTQSSGQSSGPLASCSPSRAATAGAVTVPNLVGQSGAAAVSILRTLQEQALVVTVPAAPGARAGTVIGEDPAAGSKVASGSTLA